MSRLKKLGCILQIPDPAGTELRLASDMQKLIDTMDAAFSSLAELEAEALMDAAGEFFGLIT